MIDRPALKTGGEIPQSIYKELKMDSNEIPHKDDLAVDAFATLMKSKLCYARTVKGRKGWDDPEQCSVEYLSQLLREHVDKGDPVDVANLAMMIKMRGGSIV